MLITAGFVYWYAKEAKRSADAIRQQNDLQLMPFFSLICDKDKPDEESWSIKNIGAGIALNIKYNIVDLTDKYAEVTFNIDDISILEPAETKQIKPQIRFKVGATKIPLIFEHLTDEKLQLRLKIIIRFNDIFGNKYSQEIFADKNGIRPDPIRKS